ncbi:S8 family serine peptidase [bacterium]|nr:S8 family serine peptidase [bacterium]
MRKLYLAFVVLFIGKMLNAQEKPFYYYKNEHFYLDVDYSRISIISNGDIDSSELILKKDLPVVGIKKSKIEQAGLVYVSTDKRKTIQDSAIISKIEFSNDISQQEYNEYIQQLFAQKKVVKILPTYMVSGQSLGTSSKFYVKLFKEEDKNRLFELAEDHGIQVLGYNKHMPLWITLFCGKETALNALEAANLFYETGMFECSEPELLYSDLLLSNDKYFDKQWGLKNTGQHCNTSNIDIRAESAWTLTTGSSNIKVAVFDQGIYMEHEDLKDNIYGTGYDLETAICQSLLRGSHGTACAGIIAAQQNKKGISGVAPDVKLISISCNLTLENTAQQLANGFNWAWQNGADIISNSWGGYAPSSIVDDAIRNTLSKGRNGKGTIVVFASGNENNTSIRYPGNSNPDILVVGAISPKGERKSKKSCDNENWGSCYGTALDVVAPGVSIPTTTWNGNYQKDFNGTSSACPHVAGVAALVLSVNPNLTALQVRNVIESTAQKVGGYNYQGVDGRTNGSWNEEMGYGLVDAYAAVQAASADVINFFDKVITENTRVLNYYGGINVKNVKVKNGAKLILEAAGEVNLLEGFEVELGSEFEVLH